jgi:hypothetical protein
MTHRPRLVRPPLGPVPCPGCGRPVNLVGHLELIPAHTVPQPVDHTLDEDGRRRSRAGAPCRWAGDPLPGRPDGRLARAAAEALVVRLGHDQRARTGIAS